MQAEVGGHALEQLFPYVASIDADVMASSAADPWLRERAMDVLAGIATYLSGKLRDYRAHYAGRYVEITVLHSISARLTDDGGHFSHRYDHMMAAFLIWQVRRDAEHDPSVAPRR